MRALFSAIDKKRKLIDGIKKDNEKWIRKGDEIAAEKEKVQKEVEENNRRRQECLEKQLERVSSFIAEGKEEAQKPGDATAAGSWDEVPDHVIIQGLRKHREPVALFAESKAQKFKRLCELQLTSKDEKRSDNVFIETIIGRKDTQQSQKDAKDDDIFEQCGKIERGTKHASIGDWIAKTLLAYQEKLMAESQEAMKQGKLAESRRKDAMLAQTKKNLQPLVYMLSDKTLDEDILGKLHLLVERCEKGEYIEAHDAYMRLAIGNAAWPMGVTMVGIHERAGRSKIYTSEVAHILNDETTRKYIQMIKRLLSFAQSTATEDPSKLVMMSNVN